MRIIVLAAALRLLRLDSSFLAYLAVLLSCWSRTGDLRGSSTKALPLLFASMAAFVANDVDDRERDEINHPRRPLPNGRLSPTFAVVMFFGCLGTALLLIAF